MGEEDEEKGGELIFTGYYSWSMVGKHRITSDFDGVQDKMLWGFQRLHPLVGVKIRKVICGPNSCTCMAIDVDGQLYAWGRNNHGQLGLDTTTNVYNPAKVALPVEEQVKGGSAGPHHTLIYTTEGTLLATGQGKCGQLGTGRKVDQKKFTTVNMDTKIVASGCGRDFSMIVDSEGDIYSFGHPEYGCLGNGTDGKTLEKSNKFVYDFIAKPEPIVAIKKANEGEVKIVDVACGAAHTCAMDAEGRIYTWGFGAYGRLGHKDNKTLMEPKAVELFSFEPPPPKPGLPAFMQRAQPKIRAKTITCGGTSTFVVAGEPYNQVYTFGITKKTSEAIMYPQIVNEIQGWRPRSIAVGPSSIAVASERSLITWGPSPTYGELGYGEGEKKSSTVSDEVSYLKGSVVLQVGCGMAHTLAIVDTEDESSKTKVEALEVFHPEEVDPELAAAGRAQAKAERRKAKGKSAEDDDEEDDEDDYDSDAEAKRENEEGYQEEDAAAEEEEDEEEEEEVKPKRKQPAKRGGGGRGRKKTKR